MAPPSPIQIGFGVALRRRRLAAALSQEALAHAAGLHPTYISLLERGINAPRLTVIESLAEVLGCRPYELVKAAEESSSH